MQPSIASLGPFAVLGLAVIALSGALLVRGLRARDGVLLAALALWAGPLVIQSGFVVTPITTWSTGCSTRRASSRVARSGYGSHSAARDPASSACCCPALIAGCVLLSFTAQRAWISDYALWRRAVEIEPRSWTNQKNYAAQLRAARQPAARGLALLAQPLHRAAVPAADRLERPPTRSHEAARGALIEGPGVLEPARACQLSKVYLANMRKSAPDVVRALEPVHALRYCGQR